MQNSYIISFYPGTSGRFVRYVLYSLLTGSEIDLELTDVNSSHNFNEYTGVSISDPNIRNIYDVFTFDEWAPITTPKILATHAYPEINVINKRVPDSKIILITFDRSDLLEIFGNIVYKNLFNDPTGPINHTNLLRYWNLVNDKPMVPIQLLSDDELREGIKKIVYSLHCVMTRNSARFMDDVAINSRILAIPYKELFDITTTIARLEKFTGTVANEALVKNYMKYIAGRKDFIKKYMPWLI